MLRPEFRKIIADGLSTLSPEVRAELEKQLPGAAVKYCLSVELLRLIVAAGISEAGVEGAGLSPEQEAKFIISGAVEAWDAAMAETSTK